MGIADTIFRTAWLIGDHHILHHQLCNVNYGDYYLDWLFGTLDNVPRISGFIRFSVLLENGINSISTKACK
jgi:hypothetical protein